jgi:hypothetical protein
VTIKRRIFGDDIHEGNVEFYCSDHGFTIETDKYVKAYGNLDLIESIHLEHKKPVVAA